MKNKIKLFGIYFAGNDFDGNAFLTTASLSLPTKPKKIDDDVSCSNGSRNARLPLQIPIYLPEDRSTEDMGSPYDKGTLYLDEAGSWWGMRIFIILGSTFTGQCNLQRAVVQ